MGEHQLCKLGVAGSSPARSITANGLNMRFDCSEPSRFGDLVRFGQIRLDPNAASIDASAPETLDEMEVTDEAARHRAKRR